MLNRAFCYLPLYPYCYRDSLLMILCVNRLEPLLELANCVTNLISTQPPISVLLQLLQLPMPKLILLLLLLLLVLQDSTSMLVPALLLPLPSVPTVLLELITQAVSLYQLPVTLDSQLLSLEALPLVLLTLQLTAQLATVALVDQQLLAQCVPPLSPKSLEELLLILVLLELPTVTKEPPQLAQSVYQPFTLMPETVLLELFHSLERFSVCYWYSSSNELWPIYLFIIYV